MPSPADREAWNKLRVDLYRLLLPEIQRRDQNSGAYGFTLHWNDPNAKWNDGDITHAWNAIGFDPIIQEMFYVIEQMQGEDLAVLESLDALVDPLRCPEQYLPDLAASFGYRLAEGLSEERKRAVVQGIIGAYKRRGLYVGFKTFYRMLGFEVIRIFPLWKKEQNATGDYSRVRYASTGATTPIGPMGVQVFTGRLADAPVKPGTLLFTTLGLVIGDDGAGRLLGPSGQTGTIIYSTGDYTLDLGAPAPAAVTAAFERVTDEWPMHAARIDIEIALSPFGLTEPPLVDDAFTEGLIGRLDDVRPVHVLLRTLAFVVEFADKFTPGATDKVACTTILKDVRDGLTPGSGRHHDYMIDAAECGGDELRIDLNAPASPPFLSIHPFDDRAPLVCPLDRLVVEHQVGGVTTSTDWF